MEHFITIFAVAVGWLFNEISHFFKGYADRRASANKSISLLLEVRFALVAYMGVIDILQNRFNAPPEAIQQLRQVIRRLVKIPADIVSKYEQSVDDIAGYDPLLAFRLRHQSDINDLLYFIDNLPTQPDEKAFIDGTLSPILTKKAIDSFSGKIIELAKYTNRMRRLQMKKYLAKDFKSSDEFESILKNVEAAIKSFVTAKQNSSTEPRNASDPQS